MDDREQARKEINAAMMETDEQSRNDGVTKKLSFQGLADKKQLEIIEDTLSSLRMAKPAERGEKSRAYAVVITEMEKVYAYFKTFVIGD